MTNADQPAYPKSIDDTGIGLTKRELFAAMAMQGFLAGRKEGAFTIDKEVMELCVKLADDILRQLETPKP